MTRLTFPHDFASELAAYQKDLATLELVKMLVDAKCTDDEIAAYVQQQNERREIS
jgi:hypothetical protein